VVIEPDDLFAARQQRLDQRRAHIPDAGDENRQGLFSHVTAELFSGGV
jgi:hypothetical protein